MNMVDDHVRLERTKRMLRGRKVPTNITCCGIPVEKFDKEDLIIMLGMSKQETDQAVHLHHQSLKMMDAWAHSRNTRKDTRTPT